MEAFRSFLDNYRVKFGESSTHTTKSTGDILDGWGSASYYIEKSKTEQFTKLHNDAIWENNQSPKPSFITLTEKPTVFAPLRVDFDFKAPPEVGTKRQYTKDTLKHIIKIYQEEIAMVVDKSVFTEEVLWCIVLEKPAPRMENLEIKDGFHFHFPYFVCEKWTSDDYLRSRVVGRMVQEGVWKGTTLKTKPEDIIDTGMAMKPWMMYGSCNYKNAASKPYLYRRNDESAPKIDGKRVREYGHAFDHNQEEITLEHLFHAKLAGRKKHPAYYLPEFLTVRGFSSPTILRPEIEKRKNMVTQGAGRRRRAIIKRRTDEEVLEDIKKIKDGDIMSMLSDKRAEGYNDWMEVGWTLFSIGQGHQECLDMWIDFSKRSSKFVEGTCEIEWNKMQVRDKSLGSLMRMAMIDSPDEYKNYKNYNIMHLAKDCLRFSRPTECAIARIIWCKYGDRFVCADARNDVWFQYGAHKWEQMEDGLELKGILLSEVSEIFFQMEKDISKRVADLTFDLHHLDREDAGRTELTMEIKKLKDNAKRARANGESLWTNNFQRQVVTACKIKMFQPKFLDKLDTNYKLMGFENGVLDLELHHFRDGRPDDYISISSGVEFQTFRRDDDEIREVEEYMMKVYPNPNIRECAWNTFALCLEGNVQKSFVIPTGGSDGAKTMTFNLLKAGFGEYFTRVSREQFVQRTNSNNSSAARPDILEFIGRRIVAGTELTDKDNINCSFIKEFTGQEETKARGMYSGKFRAFKLNAVLFLGCNKKPQIDGRDEATFSRIIVIDHQSKFVLPKDYDRFPVPEKFEDQMAMRRFKADSTFSARLPEIAPAFMFLLYERYKRIRNNIPPLPEEVKMSTSQYQAENDVFRKFIMQRLVRVSEHQAKKKYIVSSVIAQDFNTWYKANYSYMQQNTGPHALLIELKALLSEFPKEDRDKHTYGFCDGKLYGYEFVKMDGDDVEEEIVLKDEPISRASTSNPFAKK